MAPIAIPPMSQALAGATAHRASSAGLVPAGKGLQSPRARSGAHTQHPHSEQGAPRPFPPLQHQIKTLYTTQLHRPSSIIPHGPTPSPPPAIDLDPHPGSSSSCFRAPNSPAMCRCDPAETPASSLASIAATYPHTLTDTSPGCHPGIRGLPWPPQLTTDPPNPPQSAQGSAEISPALPANGITGNQLS